MASYINKNFPPSGIYIGEPRTPDCALMRTNLKVEGQSLGVSHVWCREGQLLRKERRMLQQCEADSYPIKICYDIKKTITVTDVELIYECLCKKNEII